MSTIFNRMYFHVTALESALSNIYTRCLYFYEMYCSLLEEGLIGLGQ